MRFIKKNPFLNQLYSTAITYPAPVNITYFWNFGIFALVCLVIQIITGIILVMHYCPHIDLAFISVEHIMRDVNYGWLLRYFHANGASVFFIVVYVHVFRGIFYGSYIHPREFLWVSGVLILFLMIITAFLGYILPWGQMSYWGATVITNLASTIPYFGETIVYWLWGGFSVSNPTLNKFFSLHYLFPFIIAALVGLHLLFLHEFGSSNPLGIDFKVDKTPFTPYFTIKDFYSVLLLILFFAFLVFFLPNTLGHPDNYIPADSEVTPSHIVPEWYFLPFYAILRTIPNKLLGVVALLASILVLFLLPFVHKPKVRVSVFKPIHMGLCMVFLANCFLLGWLGGKPVEDPFLLLARLSTSFYFLFFFLIVLIDRVEYFLIKKVFPLLKNIPSQKNSSLKRKKGNENKNNEEKSNEEKIRQAQDALSFILK